LKSREKDMKGGGSMVERNKNGMEGKGAMSIREKRGIFDRATAVRATSQTSREVVKMRISRISLKLAMAISDFRDDFALRMRKLIIDERGDVPGWVLVVLMTTGLVTGIWTIAAPRIESLLRGSLDAMNNVR